MNSATTKETVCPGYGLVMPRTSRPTTHAYYNFPAAGMARFGSFIPHVNANCLSLSNSQLGLFV